MSTYAILELHARNDDDDDLLAHEQSAEKVDLLAPGGGVVRPLRPLPLGYGPGVYQLIYAVESQRVKKLCLVHNVVHRRIPRSLLLNSKNAIVSVRVANSDRQST